ncbi:MAG: hypothetical protein H0U62_06560 [Actinobacteria bacterium]|nr:hypothetical protein [Actinomycetota bacterium]
MTFTTAALLIAWLAIVLLALGFAGLMRQLAELHRSVTTGAASAGAAAPTLRGLALPRSGDLGRIRPEGGGFILFVSPGCSSCAIALEELTDGPVDGQLVLASSGPCADGSIPAGAVCVSDTRPLMERLGVPGTPYLLDVDHEGVIQGSVLPQGPGQVRDFVAARRSTSTGGPR